MTCRTVSGRRYGRRPCTRGNVLGATWLSHGSICAGHLPEFATRRGCVGLRGNDDAVPGESVEMASSTSGTVGTPVDRQSRLYCNSGQSPSGDHDHVGVAEIPQNVGKFELSSLLPPSSSAISLALMRRRRQHSRIAHPHAGAGRLKYAAMAAATTSALPAEFDNLLIAAAPVSKPGMMNPLCRRSTSRVRQKQPATRGHPLRLHELLRCRRLMTRPLVFSRRIDRADGPRYQLPS